MAEREQRDLKRLLLGNGGNKVVAYGGRGGTGTEKPDMTWGMESRGLLADTEQSWENRESAEMGGAEGNGWETTVWL